MPSNEQAKIIKNRVKADEIDVHTTSCPASSSSLFISAAIGADDTATGVPNRAIRAGKHTLLAIPRKLPLLLRK